MCQVLSTTTNCLLLFPSPSFNRSLWNLHCVKRLESRSFVSSHECSNRAKCCYINSHTVPYLATRVTETPTASNSFDQSQHATASASFSFRRRRQWERADMRILQGGSGFYLASYATLVTPMLGSGCIVVAWWDPEQRLNRLVTPSSVSSKYLLALCQHRCRTPAGVSAGPET